MHFLQNKIKIVKINIKKLAKLLVFYILTKLDFNKASY